MIEHEDLDELLIRVQLAKASALALVSMVVIVVAVVTQGFRVPAEARGDFKGLLIINNGLTQAIGVISFGTDHAFLFLTFKISLLTSNQLLSAVCNSQILTSTAKVAIRC